MSLPYVFVRLVSLINKNIYWHNKYFTGESVDGAVMAKPLSVDMLNLASRLPNLHSRTYFLIYFLHNALAVYGGRVCF